MTPDPPRIAAVQRLLRASQGPFVAKPRLPIVDEVVATVLSQHTSDHNSERAFARHPRPPRRDPARLDPGGDHRGAGVPHPGPRGAARYSL
jgi:hypothetical protein